MNVITPPGQVPDSAVMILRLREAGDITLDLFHRDGSSAGRGSGLGAADRPNFAAIPPLPAIA